MGCGRICLIIAVLVAVLAWILKVYPWQWWAREVSLIPPVNYDGRIIFELDNLRTPKSEDAIVEIIKNAQQQNRKVRVLADGHSWSEIAQTEDIMISLAKYTGLVHDVDETTMEATFRAGTPLREMNLALDMEGYAMIQLGAVSSQSIAGAISTGTHGTGITIGNIGTLVTKLRFVSGTGMIHELNENDDNIDDFRAAQVSIGMLGVITEVTVRVKKKFMLEEFRTHHNLTYCLENLDDLVQNSGHKYLKFWIEFYNDFCILFQTNETEKPNVGEPSQLISFLTYYTFAISTRVTYLFPTLTPYTMWLVDHVGFGIDTHRVDKSYLILNDPFELPIHQEGEVIVDYQFSVPMVKAIRDVVLTERHPVNYITEVRFVAGDDVWMSPSYGLSAGTCAVTLTMYAPPNTVSDYFNAVYSATKKFNARFHWGKLFTADQSVIQSLYPKFTAFAELRKKYDPSGVFLNQFLKDTFGFMEN